MPMQQNNNISDQTLDYMGKLYVLKCVVLGTIPTCAQVQHNYLLFNRQMWQV